MRQWKEIDVLGLTGGVELMRRSFSCAAQKKKPPNPVAQRQQGKFEEAFQGTSLHLVLLMV